MNVMRQSWTDERLDDFRAEVGRRFDAVDQRLDKVDERFEKVDQRFEQIYSELLALHKLLVRLGGGVIGTLIIATIVNHL